MSYWWHIVGTYFSVHSASSFFIGEFKSFIFNIISTKAGYNSVIWLFSKCHIFIAPQFLLILLSFMLNIYFMKVYFDPLIFFDTIYIWIVFLLMSCNYDCNLVQTNTNLILIGYKNLCCVWAILCSCISYFFLKNGHFK